MADNNKNPRRTIWLSETEPLSHYDIWLSKNQHLNANGEPVSDSGVLRDCDYIFKVWDCDNWHPIVGLNATAVNKIDTVLNTSYTDSNNETHTSYSEFHLPLFTKPTNSPSELFDAGTIGEAILEYVTELEWLNIFEGDAFSDAFTYWFPTIINNGDININNFIELANTEQIGGIKADTHGTTYTNAFKPVECKLYPNYGIWSPKYERLCINAGDVIASIIESFSDPNENWLFGNHGITVGLQLGGNRIEWAVDGLGTASNGQYARCKVTEGVSRHTIEWVNLSDIYEVLGPNSSSNNYYVVKGGSNDKHYLNGDGEWTVPSGNIYYGSTTIYINQNNEISIMPYTGGPGEVYLRSINGNVSWQPINTGLTYIEGIGITINNANNSINIDTTGASTEGLVLSYDGHGDVEWISPSYGEEYEAGNGIDIESNKILCNIETIDEGTPGGSLNVSWTTLRDSILVTDNSTYNKSIGLYEVYYNDTQADYTFSLVNNSAQFENNNPIYLRLNIKNLTLTDGTKYIGNITGNGEYLVTILFGIVKFEAIETYTSSVL